MRAQDILPVGLDQIERQGITIRKGAVGAFLANARALQDTALDDAAKEQALRDIADGLPALRALGLFDILEIRDPRLRALVEAAA
ncbi:hypothetical protein GPA19_14745 [Azoarcus indigens]|uniref:Preprotein translocase subunit SecD n=1 Tax=Azoarcus indigens TaxID=29545 RepID=A0A4R6E0W2_9RHOO|nr:hypothetical protein [Azoarcus indigens]NMG66204.1 hypothetical protein [Azoarcus indigens]TDN51331.1 hypothetical protein C7389_10765 [Azoarcus indigens]